VTWIVFKGTVQETYKVSAVLMTGMMIFLVVSAIYPNRLDLRPDYVDTSNICGMLVSFLYKTDTTTNVLPSIHVFNTMALCFAVHGNKELRKRKLLTLSSDILGVLIVLSTMFLKQHSVIDVSLGLVMGVLIQIISDRIFETEEEKALAKETVYRGSSSSRTTAN
jgi:membrane-associated phospholipid phosphatase